MLKTNSQPADLQKVLWERHPNMSISPPSDIVMDVVNAANPAKHAVALQRLQKLVQTKQSAVKQPENEPFSKVLQETKIGHSEPAKIFHTLENRIRAKNNDLLAAARKAGNGGADTQLKKAHRKLEGVFLQGLISSMLSGQKDTMYGKGIAGSYWKSFMAEAIAGQITKGKGIGIADSFSANRHSKTVSTGTALLSVDSQSEYRHFFQKVFIDETTTNTSS